LPVPSGYARLALGQRAHAVVHDIQMQALEIGDFTRDVERYNLPLAVVGQLLAVEKPLQEKAARGGTVALANDILAGVERFDSPANALERVLLVIRENEDGFQLADQRAGVESFSQGRLPNHYRREHVCLSAACARHSSCKR
jgi:hypothetical protein